MFIVLKSFARKNLCAIINKLWKNYLIYFINEGDKAFLS